ncbi:hypothetical protein TNCV_5083911 [Trichonephila clavipes]|nr:hypothetical protein TNCV_5083911 [Trichonephila clavipes]
MINAYKDIGMISASLHHSNMRHVSSTGRNKKMGNSGLSYQHVNSKERKAFELEWNYRESIKCFYCSVTIQDKHQSSWIAIAFGPTFTSHSSMDSVVLKCFHKLH